MPPSKVIVSPVPPEAKLAGALNESTPAEQKAPESKAPETSGPVRGEKNEFKPATYKLASGNIRTDR